MYLRSEDTRAYHTIGGYVDETQEYNKPFLKWLEGDAVIWADDQVPDEEAQHQTIRPGIPRRVIFIQTANDEISSYNEIASTLKVFLSVVCKKHKITSLAILMSYY
jgi:hypothetical protein